jgi:hypothetical protein
MEINKSGEKKREESEQADENKQIWRKKKREESEQRQRERRRGLEPGESKKY